jgi:hypothetical protein
MIGYAANFVLLITGEGLNVTCIRFALWPGTDMYTAELKQHSA